MYNEFYQLEIWRNGYNLLMQVYDIAELFPDYEKYALASQIRRSANSIIANIAEAHGRYHYADKIKVLYISRGEIAETRSHLAVAYGQKYINEDKFKKLNEGYKQLVKGLNLYINQLNIEKNSYQKS